MDRGEGFAVCDSRPEFYPRLLLFEADKRCASGVNDAYILYSHLDKAVSVDCCLSYPRWAASAQGRFPSTDVVYLWCTR